MGQLNSALTTIQGVATGVVVLMGVISAAIIASKKMPTLDNPQSKNELINSLLAILAIIAIVAGMIWILPWVWNLFGGNGGATDVATGTAQGVVDSITGAMQ